ncbi:MAG: TIGR04283 family arsenosugar biosynthesis glycosyltransferase [Hyphomicrobiaceae bacterium]|nr:TIGR04283 family arsenosugar biosynthesis glycosyltransferase [Hyphomicrobiaceae bacterium]
MISVILPTLDAERELAATLTALVPASIAGVVREVIIVDGGSNDATLKIADDAGSKILSCAKGRGAQLAKGAGAAVGPWLLFLHADTVLEPCWCAQASSFMERMDKRDLARQGAAAFRFALDDEGFTPRFVEHMVGLRSTVLKMPYGDQGLLISKRLYEEIGGYKLLPLMEDVELVRRIGAKRLHMLPAKALTSANRYVSEGYGARIRRNLTCLGMYYAGVTPEKIAQYYERGSNEKKR